MTILNVFWPYSSCTAIGVINRGILMFALKATFCAATAFLSHENLLQTLWEPFFIKTLYQTRVSNVVLAFHSCHGIHKSLRKQVVARFTVPPLFSLLIFWPLGSPLYTNLFQSSHLHLQTTQPTESKRNNKPLINTVFRQGKKSSKIYNGYTPH